MGGETGSRSVRDMPLTCLSLPTKGTGGRTGFWRTFRPLFERGKCTKCLLCWVYCPEGAISLDAEDYPNIDYDYCKGCGICAHECRIKALSMCREEE